MVTEDANGRRIFRNTRPSDAKQRVTLDPSLHTAGVDDERPPICPACGVTMVPAALSAREERAGDWICLECEETSEPE
jgi:hypothetical protein